MYIYLGVYGSKCLYVLCVSEWMTCAVVQNKVFMRCPISWMLREVIQNQLARVIHSETHSICEKPGALAAVAPTAHLAAPTRPQAPTKARIFADTNGARASYTSAVSRSAIRSCTILRSNKIPTKCTYQRTV